MTAAGGASRRSRFLAETMPRLLAAAAMLLFAGLLARAVQRPLWFDETMAMVNYPVARPLALLAPLPEYSQAAPPLFNLLCSLLAPLPVPAMRLALAALICGGLGLVGWIVHRRWWAPLLCVVFPIFAPAMLTYATELKYYGLEMLGSGIAIGWFVTKRNDDPLAPRDVAILAAGMFCGISTMVIAAVACGLFLASSLHRRRPLRRPELALGAGLAVAMLAYYAAIRFGTAVQIANFPDSYGDSGLRMAARLAKLVVTLLGPMLPLAAVAAALAWLSRSPVDRRLLLLAAAVGAAFAILAVGGRYPAASPRHILWVVAFALFLVLAAIRAVAENGAILAGGRRRAAGGLLVLAGLVPLAALAADPRPDGANFEDNGRLAAWLAAQPPRTVGLWIGAQPMVDYYRRRYPGLGRHRYVGVRDARSLPVPPALLNPAFLAQPYAVVAARVEALRFRPGSYNHAIVYRLLKNYAAPADSLVAELPRNEPVFIVASHLGYGMARRDALGRLRSLLAALRAGQCRHRPVLKVRGGFVLEAVCGAAPAHPFSAAHDSAFIATGGRLAPGRGRPGSQRTPGRGT